MSILIQRDALTVVVEIGENVTMMNGMTAKITGIVDDPIWPLVGVHEATGKGLSWTRDGRVWSDRTPDSSDIDLVKMNQRTLPDIARDLAESLANAVEMIRKYVPEGALGWNGDGDSSVPGGSRTWAVRDEHLGIMMAALVDAKQAGLIDEIPDE